MAGKIAITRKGNKVTIEVDLDEQGEPSSSGKTTLMASTKGAIAVPDSKDGAKINLNIYKPAQ